MTHPTRTLGLSVAAGLLAAGPALGQAPVIDGTIDKAYGPALLVQDNQTGFGDSDLGLVDVANGSELDNLHAVVVDNVLYLGLGGNLESNFNKIEIFIDCRAGGQNTLRNDNAPVNFDGLNRMGTSPNNPDTAPGLTFDAGFAPDYYITLGGGGEPYTMYLDWAELLTSGGGFGDYGGSGLATEANLAANGVLFSIDNSNVAGVTGGDGLEPDGGAGVSTGLEFGIPLDVIGYDGGRLAVCVFVNSGSHDFMSNQMLGSLGGLPNLGEPRVVDLAAIAGDQFATVVDGKAGAYCGDPAAGNCCLNTATPFCSDGECCATVCATDPTCCEVAWDSGCAAIAETACVACGGTDTCGGSDLDCNGNGIADGCDIADGTSEDCNLDGIPDECQGETFFCIDGIVSEEYGAPLVVQDTQTGFGNSDLGLVDAANGSELDVLYAFYDEDHLHMLLGGNLESNFNKLEIFVDCKAGGQNTVLAENIDIDFGALQRMAAVPKDPKAGPGLTFEDDFTADFYVNLGNGGAAGAVDVYLNWATMPTDGLGLGGFGGPGLAGLPNFMDNGIVFSIDNSNVAGVDAGIEASPDGGAGVETGVEVRIPLSLMEWDGSPIRVCAFINTSGHDFVSNQLLGGLGGGDNLGDPRFLDFAKIPGMQSVLVGDEKNLCEGDFDGDGFVGGADLAALLGAWGGSQPEYDINGDGIVGGADLSTLLGAWGMCP